MAKNTLDLSTKGALSQALLDAINPGVNEMSLAVDATYGPQALGYKEPAERDLPTDPPNFSREFVMRYDWYDCTVHPLVRHVSEIADENITGAEASLAQLLERILDEECAPQGQGSLPDVPDAAKAVMRNSAQDAINIISQYNNLTDEPA